MTAFVRRAVLADDLSLTVWVAAEGGADSWARPALPRIDEKRDSIGAYITGLMHFLTHGVTSCSISTNWYRSSNGLFQWGNCTKVVWSDRGTFFLLVPSSTLTSLYRPETVSLHLSLVSFRTSMSLFLEVLRNQISTRLQSSWTYVSWLRIKHILTKFSLQRQAQGNFVRQIEIVKRRSLWGYRGDDWIPFMKIVISEPRNLPKIRDKWFFGDAFYTILIIRCHYACLKGESVDSEISSLLDNRVLRSRATLYTLCVSWSILRYGPIHGSSEFRIDIFTGCRHELDWDSCW